MYPYHMSVVYPYLPCSNRPKVDAEADAQIEGSLAAEASLVVLDTLELLMQGAHLNDNMHTLLARVGRVLLWCYWLG